MNQEPFQIFDRLDPATEAALVASIDRHGVLVPVFKDQHGNILDGHQRSRIADSLGVVYNTVKVEVEDEEHGLEIARTLNTDRRHLTPEQRREMVKDLREEGHSQTAIAGAVGVSQSTVRDDLAELSRSTRFEPPERVMGLDGKSRPATRTDTSRPHVSHNSGENEWYTPPVYLEAAREVMGGIDLDPASSDIAQENVRAEQYFTVEDNGLERVWWGRVWMNPPYSRGLVWPFCERLSDHYADGLVTQAVVLVNNATETAAFQRMAEVASAICFPARRIKYLDASLEPAETPLQGQAFLYFGDRVEEFRARFVEFGFTAVL